MSKLRGKKIVILGGTGTLGRALTKKLLQEHPDIQGLTIFSRDEVKQLDMMETYSEEEFPQINYLLGDVRDIARLREMVEGQDIVVHAAALKHVVMAERNPGECYKTNVEGTRNVVLASQQSEVHKAILVSTDKAENPIGVYGRSKLEAEEIFTEANIGSSTDLSIVRLGNIVGARGSVFEAFEKQKEGGTLKVTHEEATRFCISAEEAATFIISMMLQVDGEQIQFPKMRAFSVLELAKQIAPDCEIEIVGLRPGDKLHEELGGKTSQECLAHENVSIH